MQRYAHFVSITTKAIVAAYERNFSICPENECNCLLCRILEDPRLHRALDKNKSHGSPIWKRQSSGPGGRGSQWQPRGERREERQTKEMSEKKSTSHLHIFWNKPHHVQIIFTRFFLLALFPWSSSFPFVSCCKQNGSFESNDRAKMDCCFIMLLGYANSMHMFSSSTCWLFLQLNFSSFFLLVPRLGSLATKINWQVFFMDLFFGFIQSLWLQAIILVIMYTVCHQLK